MKLHLWMQLLFAFGGMDEREGGYGSEGRREGPSGPDPAEPFTLQASRSNGDELFTGFRFTSQQRQDTIRGVTQTRKGTAEKRNVMGIL